MAEQFGLQKVDEQLLFNRIDYDEVLALRKEMLWTEEEKRYYKTLKNGSQAGLTPVEQFRLQKVDEQLLFNRIDYDEVLALTRVDYDEVLALTKGVSGGGTQISFVDMMSSEEAVRY